MYLLTKHCNVAFDLIEHIISLRTMRALAEYLWNEEKFTEKSAANSYCNLYQMNKFLEEHTLRVQIYIKELLFSEISPANIAFQISSEERHLAESKKTYSLEGDSIRPYEKLSFTISAQFDNRKGSYISKELSLSIDYTSSKGKSGTKSVKFDPFTKSKDQKTWVLPGQANSQFKITFITSYSFLSKKTKTSQVTSNAFDHFGIASGKGSKLDKRGSAINELIKTDTKKDSQVNILQKDSKKIQQVKSVPLQSKKHITRNRFLSPKYVQESDETTKAQEQFGELRKKIQLQRQEKVRSISKLKMQIGSHFLGGNHTKEDDTQITKLKQKLRNFQRKEKSLLLNLQELNNELEKRKTKIIQLQKVREQGERIQAQKDIKLKAALNNVRILSEQLDGLTSKERVTSKKTDVREGAFRDQLAKLENKLKLAEMQVIKVNQQKNSIIKSFSELQKIHQGSLKEKDKVSSQQKVRMFKLKEEWSIQEKTLLNSIEQYKTKTEMFLYQKNQTEERILTLQNSIFKYETQLQSIKDSSKKMKQEYERIHQQSIKALTAELNSAKLRGNQLNSQNSLLKEKIKRLQVTRSEAQSKIHDLQETIKLKNTEITKNTSKINSLRQQLDSSTEENLRKGRQIENLKQTNTNFKNKWNQAKQKLDDERSKREQLSCLLEKQMNDFSKQKQSYEGEIKDLKWIVDRNNDNINELQYQIKDLNTNSLTLNEQLMVKAQRLSSLEEKNKILNNQNDHLIQQKVSLAAKIKQLTQSLKIKTMQWQDQKKARIKAQAKAQEQKQRAQQYLAYSKGRQTQDGDKLREKEQLCSKKLDQLNALDLQINKKNEQIVLLKNSCESVLRQMQLCKMDNDSIKNELNLLDANFKSLKQQYSVLQINYESVTTNLSTSDQNFKVQSKKLQLLSKQFEDYRNGIQSTLQNLLVQLFKQENNSSNVIAATLLPFPSPKLSNLQVELVQRRNSFIIKHRQKISDLTNQIDLLQNQLKQLKSYQDARIQASSKNQLEEREKLKGLIYENMVQKNRLGEQLANEKKQREEIQKEIQKFKIQLFRRDDNEQELNGQLQMLLLQYDGIKNQNQDLNDLLFKYKEQEIKLKGECEQKLTILQEDLSSQLERVKIESIEREKKSIQLEKQLIEISSKMQRIEEEKQKNKQEIQMLKDSSKMLEEKLQYYQGDITRLNNTIRSMEKRELSYKENTQRYQQQLSQQAQKYEALQSGSMKLSSELFEANVLREKISGELEHYKEKCSQLQKLVLQKGEVNKQKIQKKMEENSLLRSAIIQKTSDIELRDFYLKQKQQQNISLTEQIQEFKKNQASLKIKLKELSNALQDSQSKIKQLTHQSQEAARQIMRKDQLLGQSSFMIISLQNQLEEGVRIGQILKIKQKQCIQLREGKSQMEEYYLQQLKKSKTINGQLKQQIKTQKLALHQLQEEYKSSIENVSKSNHKKYRYLETEWMQDKDQFSKRVEEIQLHNRKVIAQFESRLQKAREDLQDCKDSQRNLLQQLHKKETALKAHMKKIQTLENEVEEFKQKYNKYYLLHQQAKLEEEHNLKDSQNKYLQSLQNNRATMTKQFAMKVQDIERKIKRVRQTEQIDIRAQSYSKKQLQNMLDRIFSKLNDIMNDSEFKSGLLWERSKIQSTLM